MNVDARRTVASPSATLCTASGAWLAQGLDAVRAAGALQPYAHAPDKACACKKGSAVSRDATSQALEGAHDEVEGDELHTYA